MYLATILAAVTAALLEAVMAIAFFAFSSLPSRDVSAQGQSRFCRPATPPKPSPGSKYRPNCQYLASANRLTQPDSR